LNVSLLTKTGLLLFMTSSEWGKVWQV